MHPAVDRIMKADRPFPPSHSIHAYKTDPPHESHFSPQVAADFLNGEEEDVTWLLGDYLPTGSLALLAGKPKEGKSTLTYELAVKVAQGQPFLNRETTQTGVLILALEEHPRDVRLRLRGLGAEDLSNLHIACGRLDPTPDLFDAIAHTVKAEQIGLVIIDTLTQLWNVMEENNAAEVTKAMAPFLALARESGACVLLIHHARKSEGAFGDEIRGSGAVFASVDVALILKRHEVATQRTLHGISRYADTPAELVLNLTEAGYVALGDPAQVNKAARLERVKAALADTFAAPKDIAKLAKVPLRSTYLFLADLFSAGAVAREGSGKKNDGFRYRLPDSLHASPLLYRHESNPTLDDSLHVTPRPPDMNRK